MLVEHPDEQAGLEISSALRFAGYAVVICPGPPGRGKCPLTGPEGCAPAHDADLVVCALGYEGDTGREVLREMRTRYPSVPVLVEVPSEIDAELERMLEGCEQLPAPATAEQVLAPCRLCSARRAPRIAPAVRSPFSSEREAFRTS